MLLAIGLLMRSTINFSNYIAGFKYLKENTDDSITYEDEFIFWFHY